tara:strand:+ start:983 stop:1384 length:402 start_codon:yes stop_codon:yes gene_type:complete
MKTIRQFLENVDERRALLKQRQRDQVSAFKERGSQRAQSAMQTSNEFRQRSQEQNKAAIERARAAKAARADARAEAEAKKKEREDISAEIAASREEKIDQREADKKKNDQKRMSKERVQAKRRERVKKTMGGY